MICRSEVLRTNLRKATPATTSSSKPHTAPSFGRTIERVLDADLTDPTQLIETLETFFSHRPQAYVEWETAVAQFKDRVPALGNGLAELIERERGTSRSVCHRL